MQPYSTAQPIACHRITDPKSNICQSYRLLHNLYLEQRYPRSGSVSIGTSIVGVGAGNRHVCLRISADVARVGVGEVVVESGFVATCSGGGVIGLV